MLISIRGNLVVERFTERHSLLLLSVPAARQSSKDFLEVAASVQPKATKAANVARSSAEVEAHWDPFPGRNK